ncbi:F0F1 ATP synthase subunit A [Tissierella pigra]|uniref:ATP synthase subunit a n=1 Tax=Tissierella pigra TaxID=2607614 RepID=A0A6N7XUK9_9FIRM|nr:F0F1 ATP synthase subunit A [Tissierella pigra]MBU5427839.1 F0F1 ATP synthase subunit A [Tissierella pigra]MSU00165.1 F0F1 ATP synthase subunit A [Tissierella pigra]
MEVLIQIGGKEIFIPDTIVNVWFVAIVLIVFALVVNSKMKKAKLDEEPSNFQLILEVAVESIDNLVKTTMGEQNLGFAPYIFTLITFIMASNLSGLLGITAPTSDYSVTISLALITFVLSQYWNFKNSGGLLGYLKGYTEPMALLTPLNVIGDLANPISLSFRLFGNVMGGGIIMGLLYSALGYFAPIVTAPLHIYFDIFSGVLQSFIFTMLSMIFIGGKEA